VQISSSGRKGRGDSFHIPVASSPLAVTFIYVIMLDRLWRKQWMVDNSGPPEGLPHTHLREMTEEEGVQHGVQRSFKAGFQDQLWLCGCWRVTHTPTLSLLWIVLHSTLSPLLSPGMEYVTHHFFPIWSLAELESKFMHLWINRIHPVMNNIMP
jgi:hypothetical protein